MDHNEFLNSLATLIRNHDTGNGLLVSNLGFLLERAHGHRSWERYGFKNLKSALLVLKEQGGVRDGLSEEKAYKVWSCPSTDGGVCTPQAPSVSPVHSYQRLKPRVWNAFISEFPKGRRFLNANTGDVVMGVDNAPTGPEKWLEIPPVSQETQKDWAHIILEERNVASQEQFADALSVEKWYISLSEVLGKHDQALLSAWHRIRTQKIVSIVRTWCQENCVSENLVFQASRSQYPLPLKHPTSAGSVSLREALLSAVSKMTTEELLEIRLPAKYLIDYLPVK